MNMPDVPLLSMLRQQMTWLQARQSVLSQNVSNADTPGYTANDLKPMDFENMLKGNDPKFQSGLLTTNDHHITISPSQGTGSNSPDTERVSSLRSTCSGRSSKDPDSSRDKSNRSTESLRSRST